jgi:SAM-dependent methyltransferase
VRTISIACDLCGGADKEFLFEGRDRLHGIEGKFTYVRCKSCGLVYMDPQIAPECIGRFYPKEYGPHQEKVERRPRSRRALMARLAEYSFVASLLQGITSETRILDVGCGSGEFLHQLKTVAPCKVYGLDNAENAKQTAQRTYGIDVFGGNLLEVPFPDGYFDVVTAWWYLEHVPNPSQILQKMNRLLKDGGHCILRVPNIGSFNGRVFRDKWYHLDCPRHLFLYSPQTLTRLLAKSGFDVAAITFDKTPRGLIGSLRYRFGDENVPLKRRRRPHGLSLLKTLLLPWAVLMAAMGQSDSFVVRARKCSPAVPIVG